MLNWFKKKTVDSILSKWTKTIQDLEDHAEAKIDEALKHNALVTFYSEATDLATKEAAKARDVIGKLKSLFA
jgi:hypothetical protein